MAPNSKRDERVSVFSDGSTFSSRSSGSSKRKVRPSKFNYKPFSLRLPFLVLLLPYALALIGLLEYAIHRLLHGNEGLISDISDRLLHKTDVHYVVRRQVPVTFSTFETAYMPTGGTATLPASSSAASSNYLNSDGTTTTALLPVIMTVSSAYVQTGGTVTVYTTPRTSSIASSAYLQTQGTYTPSAPQSAPTSHYLNPDGTQTLPLNSASTSSSSSTTPAVLTSDQTAYLNSDGTATFFLSSTPSNQSPSPEDLPTPSTPTSDTQQTTPSYTVASSAAEGAYLQSDGTQTIFASLTSDAYVHTGNTQPITAVTSHTISAAYLHDSGTATETPPTDTHNTASVQPTGSTQPAGEQGKVVIFHWTKMNAFIGTYLAVILAVIFRILISVVANDFTLIDPFRQMMAESGAKAERAFFSFYQSQSNIIGPIRALTKGRWALASVAVACLASCMLPALASEAIWVSTDWGCSVEFFPGTDQPCEPRMIISVAIARICQGLLALGAAVILGLMLLLLLRKTGLPANPSSIATVASLMQHPGLNEDLHEMPNGNDTTPATMAAALRGKRYGLGFWKDGNGGTSYGIRPMHVSLSPGMTTYEPIAGGSSSETENSSRRYRLKDLFLVFIVSGAFGVVLAYYLDGNDDGFNRFFSSNTFGPRFILTGAGTVIASMWKSAEQSSLITAPFIRLSQRQASAGSTLCFAPSNVPLLSTWITLRNRYFLPALITIIAFLAETLNVVISGVPFTFGRLWIEFLVSVFLSLGILGLMTITSGLVILHRRREPTILTHPDTLGTKMAYLSGSKMLEDFDGVEWEDEKARDRRIRGMKKKYEFKASIRSDGKRTWLVDEVSGPERYRG